MQPTHHLELRWKAYKYLMILSVSLENTGLTARYMNQLLCQLSDWHISTDGWQAMHLQCIACFFSTSEHYASVVIENDAKRNKTKQHYLLPDCLFLHFLASFAFVKLNYSCLLKKKTQRDHINFWVMTHGPPETYRILKLCSVILNNAKPAFRFITYIFQPCVLPASVKKVH